MLPAVAASGWVTNASCVAATDVMLKLLESSVMAKVPPLPGGVGLGGGEHFDASRLQMQPSESGNAAHRGDGRATQQRPAAAAQDQSEVRGGIGATGHRIACRIQHRHHRLRRKIGSRQSSPRLRRKSNAARRAAGYRKSMRYAREDTDAATARCVAFAGGDHLVVAYQVNAERRAAEISEAPNGIERGTWDAAEGPCATCEN